MSDEKEYLQLIDDTIAAGKYKADWSSLSGHKLPSWYYEGKFGEMDVQSRFARI